MDGNLREEYNRIYEKYAVMVYQVAYQKLRNHHVVQDIVQETFLALYQSSHVLANEQHAKAWLIRVCSNKIVDYIRREQQERCVYMEDLKDHEVQYMHTSDNPIEAWIKSVEEQEILHYAWERLYQKDKRKYMMLVEAVYSEKSLQELAKQFGVSTNTFSKTVSRIRKFMAKTMDEYEHEIRKKEESRKEAESQEAGAHRKEALGFDPTRKEQQIP